MSKVKLLFVALFLLFASLLSGLPAFATGKESPTKTTSPFHVNFNAYPRMVYPIRIGLATHSASSWVYAWEPAAVFVDEKAVFALAPRHVYILANGRITDAGGGSSYKLPHDRRAHIASGPLYRICTNNHWYRGCLELIWVGNRITVINLLDLEDYLRGVVPAEMPASWHIEALKAQAVAARSYAYAHMGSGSKWYRTEGYDVVPDVRDQAYKGLAAETNSTSWAVKLTQGIILKDSGRVKPGFYRAWVGDDFENLNMRKSTVSNAVLEKITGVSKIIGVAVKQWDQNGNARSVQVIGAKKSREVYGVALAKMLRFSTAGILDVKEHGHNWIFTYRGPGNGARGLSQHGANMLAARGWPFPQILQQYYQDPDGRLRFDYMDRYKYAGNYRQQPTHTSKSEASTENTNE